MKTLTKRQDAFATEYVKDGNATQAAIRAGYSKRTAKQQGSRLLTNVDLQQRLEEGAQIGHNALIDEVIGGKSESAKVQAATALMDRGWGKAIARHEVSSRVVRISIDLSGSNEEPPAEMLDETYPHQ
jgi:hypothetical protein